MIVPLRLLSKLALAVAMVGLVSGNAAAQSSETQKAAESIQLTRDAIQKSRRDIVNRTLTLTPDQRAKFKPIYDQYEAERAKIGDERFKLWENFKAQRDTLTDGQAADLLERFLSIQERRTALLRKYATNLRKVLPAKIAAQAVQLEQKMDAAVDHDLSGRVDPL